MRTVLQIYDIPGSYFELPEDSIAQDESLEEPRYADRSELWHIVSVSLHDWEKGWKPEGAYKCPLKGQMADAAFFYPLVHSPNDSDSSAAVLR